MKKLAKILLSFFFLLLVLILLIPVFFKDKIKALIIREFEKSTEATIYFDTDKFGLSMIKRFPDFSVTLGDFGIVGKGIFEGDTLMQVEGLEASVNLRDVLFGDKIEVKSVHLDEPEFLVMVLADGSANYDIAKESPSVATDGPVEEGQGAVSFGISSFSINNGDFIYLDQASNLITELEGINFKGRGDFAEEIFDLVTTGVIQNVRVNYDGTEYLANKQLDLDLILNMDLPNSIYTFKDNKFIINDFPINLTGSFQLLADAYQMDIGFSSPATDFKHLFSLVPGVYKEGFEDLKADGKVAFEGKVNGKYAGPQLPTFDLNLTIIDGSFQYPELPAPVSNIQLDLAVNNTSGVIANTSVDLKKLHMNFGESPFDARVKIENLKDYPIDANIKGKINLSELNQMLPMEGLALAGDLHIDATAHGIYDSARSMIPVLDVDVHLKDGIVKSGELPAPLENIQVRANIRNVSGRMKATKINVRQLNFSLDNQPFESSMTLENPENLQWDFKGKGQLDIEKLMKFYPMEGTEVKGKLVTDITSTGNMADLEAKRYRKLSTSGELSLTDFSYEDASIGQDYGISHAKVSFSPRAIKVHELNGKAGQTNYSLAGNISNYLGFLLNEEKLTGDLKAEADFLNISEWMTATDGETTEEETPTGTEEPEEMVKLPENMIFTLDTKIDEVTYHQLNMTDVKGKVLIKDGVLDLNKMNFNALKGVVDVQGKFDTRQAKPMYDFKFNVKDLSIPASFQSIDMVQRLAPVTAQMTGSYSTDFAVSGALGEDLMPDYSTVTGKGIIQVFKASLGKQSGLVSSLASTSKLSNITSATLDKIKMTAEIKDGRLHVKPFRVKIGDYHTVVDGSTGIDGSLDYRLKMDVPAGEIGTQLNSLISSFTGNATSTGSQVKLNLNLKGSYTEPKFGITGIGSGNEGTGSSVKASIQTKVEEKKEAAKEEVKQEIEEKKQTLQREADALLKQQKDSLATKLSDQLGLPRDSSNVINKELNDTKKKAEDLLKGFFKKKKKKKKDNLDN